MAINNQWMNNLICNQTKGSVLTCNGWINYSVGGCGRELIDIVWIDSEGNEQHHFEREYSYIYSFDDPPFKTRIRTVEYETTVSRLKKMIVFFQRCQMMQKIIRELGDIVFVGYDIDNGFIGMKKFVILRLFTIVSHSYWGSVIKVRVMLGMCGESYLMKYYAFFKLMIKDYLRELTANGGDGQTKKIRKKGGGE
jgi:hypothetical protein